MADGIFNIAKGAYVEKIRDAGTDILLLILQANEAEATLVDRTTVALMLAEGGTTEATFTNYARKTGITGTITVDNSNDRVDVDIPDQVFTTAGGATNNTTTKVVIAYEESAADSGRIPISHHDAAFTTDGTDVTIQINAAGFARSS